MSTERHAPLWLRAGLACAAGALLAAAPLAASGRVFERWGRATHGAVSAGQPGWNLAYATTLRVNEGGGRMEVIGCDMRLGETLQALDAAYRGMGCAVFLARAPRMAWGLAVQGDRVITMLLVALTPGRECLLFRMEQSREAFRRAMSPPSRHLLEGVPVPPGARPQLFVADEETGTAVEVSSTGGAPGAAVSFLESALVSEGWTPMMRPDPRVGARPLLFYARGRDLCAFQVGLADRGAVVTRLLKQRD